MVRLRQAGAFRVTSFGTARQVGDDVVRHGQRHSAIVDFDMTPELQRAVDHVRELVNQDCVGVDD